MRGRRATKDITDRGEARGLKVVRSEGEGTPHQVILEYVRENEIDLIVMGTHGMRSPDRVRLGSTTERVITLGNVPVMSVRLAGEGDAPDVDELSFEDVVIPTDGSDFAERAAQRALSLVESYDATVHAIYVVDTTTYDLKDAPRSIVGLLKEGGRRATDAIATEARDRGLAVRIDVLRGIPDEEVLSYADGVNADLIAMGTRGRAAGTDRLLGSTTARVVRRSDRPVLTVN